MFHLYLSLMAFRTLRNIFNPIEFIGWWSPSHYLWNAKLRRSWGMDNCLITLISSSICNLRNPFINNLVFLYRSLMIEAMMGQLQTSGRVAWYSLCCLQVTYLLMILILWIFIKRWVFPNFMLQLSIVIHYLFFTLIFQMCRFQQLNSLAPLGYLLMQWNL